MTTPSQTLPHRAVSSIRGGAVPSLNTSTATSFSGGGGGGSGSGDNPRTPLRGLHSGSSSFSSPSSLRADEEVLILEFGARRIRVGFAGDATPKAVVAFGPETARRVGDFRRWEAGFSDQWRRRSGWCDDYELWRGDVRGLDLGLVGDRLERGLREAFSKYLLIDSRPRKVVAILPSGIPVPLLATALDTLFNRFHAPTVALLSSPVACAVASGVRCALVVDMGWAETTVTAVYEYKEVQSQRSVRAGQLLVENTHKLLASMIRGEQPASTEEKDQDKVEHMIAFEECENVANRLVWCKPAGKLGSQDQRQQQQQQQQQDEGLSTVAEQDETESSMHTATATGSVDTAIPLKSTSPPTTLHLTYEQLSEPAETTFFDSQHPPCYFDDHELPLPLLIYRSLLKLPLDVRGLCMARIIFTGGCSNVLGLRGRIFEEVNQLTQKYGWDPVRGKAVEAYKTNPKLRRGSRQASNSGPSDAPAAPFPDSGGGGGGGGGVAGQGVSGGHEQDGVWVDAASDAQQEPDPVEDQIRKWKHEKPRLQGQLRAVETLGAWSGASLLNFLKAPALATVEREQWREQGVSGASRPHEVDQKLAQRQSMGGSHMRTQTGASWTLGVWGYL